jgi:hypothetical protein
MTPTEDQALVSAALEALYESTGIQGKLRSLQERLGTQTHDAWLTLNLKDGPADYLAKCKSIVDRELQLVRARELVVDAGEQGILVAPYLSPRMAELSFQMKLQFIDTAGNAYLNRSGNFVFINGRKMRSEHYVDKKRSVGNAAAMHLIFALLCEHALIRAPYRDMVKRAKISLGAISPVIGQLEERGFISKAEVKNKRRFLEAGKLLDEWSANYALHFRPKLHVRKFSAQDPAWWQKAELEGTGALWGGEVAAERMTNYLSPEKVTLYLQTNTDWAKLAMKYHFRADPAGSIEMLPAFWEVSRQETAEAMVPPILVYADLLGSLDARNIETADQVRRKYIDHAGN